MHLFPERGDPRGRRLLPAALILSLLVHLAGGEAWVWFGNRVAPALAKLLPRATPPPEIVALSDAIRIEKRTVPREAHRAVPHPRAQQRPRPRQVAQVPTLRSLPVPTLPPIRTPAPQATPAAEATPARAVVHATIHQPRAEATAEPTAVPPTPPPAKNAFSRQQLAALDAQFSRTIAQAQRSLSNVPPQRRPPARNPDQQRYEQVMAGTPEQFFAAFQGDCVPLQGPLAQGPVRAYYIRCFIRYNDGYFENVSYPWLYRFPARRDPFDERANPDGQMMFPPQGPPDGTPLPPHFALSRAVCTFYRAECQSVIDRERANGNQPATDSH